MLRDFDLSCFRSRKGNILMPEDPIAAIADLQSEVAALRQLLILLLARQALATDDPRETLEMLKRFIGKTSGHAPDNEDSVRMHDAMVEAVDRADWLVRALGGGSDDR
jgi:hypothetical protein